MDKAGFFLEMTTVLWGNYGFQALFYFSLVIILILEKERIRKAMGFWYSICILFVIYNPVMYTVCNYIFSSEYLLSYYCRLFCLLPIVFVISYASVLLLKRAIGWRKVCYTLLVIFMVGICGHAAYGEEWFTKATNVNKVPEDVLQICALFQGQEDISIMVPTELTVYMRQMNSNFSMPYGRNKKLGISSQLQAEAPDVQVVLGYAVSTDTEYLVACYSEDALRQYMNEGCEIVGYTDHYVVLRR